MVTTRRTVENDTDRYGSFSEPDRNVSAEEILLAAESRTAERTTIPAEKEEERKLVISTPVQPEQKSAVRSTEDMMPSIVRVEDDEQVEYMQEEKLYARRDKKMPAAMRNLLIAYMVLIVAVVAGVIATGIASSAVASSVSALEAAVAAQEEIVAVQESLLEIDAGEIKEAAEQLGMSEYASADGTYSVLTELASENGSNPFDEFRDRIYEILG